MRHTIKLILLSIFLFTGCNSSKSKTKENNQNELFTYNNSTVNNHSNKNNLTLTGKVIDGEIKGATVFLDLNRNDKIDNGEPNTTTESDGSFTLILYESHQQHKNYLNHTAPLVAFGGTDIRTGNKFQDYLLSMTEGNLVVNITPLTTLITQSLKEEIKKDSNKLFQKTTEELQSDIDKKIAGIKKNISELLGIREDLLTKNPIALVKEGDNSLLNTSLQLQKTAQEMKKAMKKKVRGLKHSILYSYRSLGRELQKLEKKANKSKESALIEALDSAMNDSSVFNEDLVEDIKNGSKELIKSINNFWSGDKEILDDNDLNEAVKRLEVIVDDGESILTEIPTPTPTVILTPTPTAIPTPTPIVISTPTPTAIPTPTPIVISTPTPTVIPTETPTPISINTNIPSNIDDATAIRFLNKATFGANKESIEDLKFKGVVAWLNEQLNLPLNDNQYLIKMIELAKKMSPNENSYTIKEYFADNDIMFNHDIASFQSPRYRMSSWFDIALTSKDQLRQKVTYALSQIIVESDFEPIFKRRAEALATYFDILQRNAFGNYKDLLNEISLSSGMGVFLTFNGNKKKYQNEANVTVYPDENYAREIMQLFSIGLMKLNIDGTSIFNNGKPIPTYTQNDVNELARVFTGWDLKRNNKYGKVGIKRGDYTHPLEFTPDYHDNGEKKLLGKTIPAGLTGEQDIQKAIDIIMSNSSVAPFISKQLIMRLTKSNPS
ncbi:MAG: DUF1800 family protein, partial [Sulfurovaceae bacterium]|nr:DUF1800 family protein [Sulfurovaceae bacterium]